MKFEEVLPSLREGKAIKRTGGFFSRYIGYYKLIDNQLWDMYENLVNALDTFELLADDWEIVEEKTIKEDEFMAKNKECQDSYVDSMCCDCVEEATYSSREYYDLKKECIEKDHEIFLLKRKVEALEYLIYNCIPKDDRRAD